MLGLTSLHPLQILSPTPRLTNLAVRGAGGQNQSERSHVNKVLEKYNRSPLSSNLAKQLSVWLASFKPFPVHLVFGGNFKLWRTALEHIMSNSSFLVISTDKESSLFQVGGCAVFLFWVFFFLRFCVVCHVHPVLGDYKEPSAPLIQRQINRSLVLHLIVLLFCHVRRRSKNRGDRTERVFVLQNLRGGACPQYPSLPRPPPSPPPPTGRQCDTEWKSGKDSLLQGVTNTTRTRARPRCWGGGTALWPKAALMNSFITSLTVSKVSTACLWSDNLHIEGVLELPGAIKMLNGKWFF